MKHFANNQWAVTDFGLETVGKAPTYLIPADRLAEITGDGRCYVWPLRSAEKTWVEVESFIEAYMKALTFHVECHKSGIDSKILEESLAKARLTARLP